MNFVESANLFLNLLTNMNLSAIKEQQSQTIPKKVGVVCTPWLFTAVPWYSIFLALLYQFKGYHSYIIWDDMTLLDEEDEKFQNKIISQILEKISNYIEIVKLSELNDSCVGEIDIKQVDKCSQLNAIIRLKNSASTEQLVWQQQKYKKVLLGNLKKIKTILGFVDFDHILVPGGIYGNSGLFMWAGKQAQIRVATYDSGHGFTIIGTDDVAAYQKDITQIIKSGKFGPFKNAAINLAKDELNLRMQGKDRFSFQSIPYANANFEQKFDIVIPLNIDWDAAALGMYKFFDDSYQWLSETVNFILNETTGTVAVRQHPAEKKFASNQHMKLYLEQLFGNNPRFSFFSSNEQVNIYNLLENAQIVLPHVSTVGIEGAILGKHVVLASDCYYSDMPFVKKAASKNDYFAKIKQCLISKVDLLESDIESAWLFYYFSQGCSFIPTDFTPQPNDFVKWVKRPFVDLLNDEIVDMIFTSLSQAIPVALLYSDKLLEKHAKPAKTDE